MQSNKRLHTYFASREDSFRISNNDPAESPTRSQPSLWDSSNSQDRNLEGKSSHGNELRGAEHHIRVDLIRNDGHPQFLSGVRNLQQQNTLSNSERYFKKYQCKRLESLIWPWSSVAFCTQNRKDCLGCKWSMQPCCYLLTTWSDPSPLPSPAQEANRKIDILLRSTCKKSRRLESQVEGWVCWCLGLLMLLYTTESLVSTLLLCSHRLLSASKATMRSGSLQQPWHRSITHHNQPWKRGFVLTTVEWKRKKDGGITCGIHESQPSACIHCKRSF